MKSHVPSKRYRHRMDEAMDLAKKYGALQEEEQGTGRMIPGPNYQRYLVKYAIDEEERAEQLPAQEPEGQPEESVRDRRRLSQPFPLQRLFPCPNRSVCQKKKWCGFGHSPRTMQRRNCRRAGAGQGPAASRTVCRPGTPAARDREAACETAAQAQESHRLRDDVGGNVEEGGRHF